MSIRRANESLMLVHVRRTSIPRPTESLLWGRSAGRCEFAGCNKPLWKSPVTQETVNIAEKAHIYAFSSRGPRGKSTIPKKRLNDGSNLLLVCHDCHRTIDSSKEFETRYPAEMLQRWKAEHERRVEVATAIAPDKKSHILLYGANIGEHHSALSFNDAAAALFPNRYPADSQPISLGMPNSAIVDRDSRYWDLEAANLATRFDRRVVEPRSAGLIGHISVFGLAPQPLLILLGSLLVDITHADVYQRRREPITWQWADSEMSAESFIVREPANLTGFPALIISLSASIDSARVLSINAQYSIWELTIENPNNDFLKDQQTLSAFREQVRSLLNRIKLIHGQTSELAIFPAMPVACAIEFGRVRMPKADMPLHIYDQIQGRGFLSAIRIPRSVA